MEEASLDDPRAKGHAPAEASTSSLNLPVSRYDQAALVSLRAPPNFKPLRAFELHLQEDYKSLCRDHMQRIHDFGRKKDDTPCTMYTRLTKFIKKSGNVFPEHQLVKVFLSKIDKRHLILAMSWIIMEFGEHATLQRHLALWNSKIVHCINTMPLFWCPCLWILASPRRLQLQLQDWQRCRWTR